MGRRKEKELSPLLSKSGVLSLLLSVSEPRAPPYTTEMIPPIFLRDLWGILGLPPRPPSTFLLSSLLSVQKLLIISLPCPPSRPTPLCLIIPYHTTAPTVFTRRHGCLLPLGNRRCESEALSRVVVGGADSVETGTR